MATPNNSPPVVSALTLLSSPDLPADMEFLTSLGFQLTTIQPDDDPSVAVMKGHGAILQLRRGATCPPATLILGTDDKDLLAKEKVVAPCGATFKFEALTYEVVYPETTHKLEVCLGRENPHWMTGRAGMLYRDLLPSRLGGAVSASHIRIPAGGPVPDLVHYHTITFQLIYCLRGWVKLVYEDQGPPFILSAGDCVTQPNQIRHRVLEASDNLEVVEVGVPATHMTTIDHDMSLPTQTVQPSRHFSGQVFCHHKAGETAWVPGQGGIHYRETGVKEATGGLASVRILRCQDQIPKVATHDADIYWSFLLSGAMRLEQGGGERTLVQGDAFAASLGEEWKWENESNELTLLEVALPGNFNAAFRHIAE